ncbi:MAG: DUF429 domain-containing protein [Anaerolineales bacterium]|nr:DUF429 domain-containing protein [Anaerolineales bacterium]
MLFNQSTFLGIDPTAGKRPLTYVAIDQGLNILSICHGSIDETLAFVAGQASAVIAVCAPNRPNMGLMQQDEVRARLIPPPRLGRWINYRVAEYQLRCRHITIPQTPAEESKCPRWMKMGFKIFQRLEKLGYQPYPSDNDPHQYLEVYPHASYTVLLEKSPYPKHSLEGRLQRQLILYENNINVADPMRFLEEITRHRILTGSLPLDLLLSAEELDALVAAFTAWWIVNHPDQSTSVGDTQEGLIFVPTGALKTRYQSAK